MRADMCHLNELGGGEGIVSPSVENLKKRTTFRSLLHRLFLIAYQMFSFMLDVCITVTLTCILFFS
jgi:hypothetical protein